MLLPRYLYIAVGLVALILIGNLVLLDFFFVRQRDDLLSQQTRLTQMSESIRQLSRQPFSGDERTEEGGVVNPAQLYADFACPQTCVGLIKLATRSSAVRTSPATVPAATTTTTTSTATKGEYVIPLGSGSTTKLNSWEDINAAQAALDTGNYSSIKVFYFEAILRTDAGEVKARLYDATTPFIYAGEELKSTSNTGQLLSVAVPLRSGAKTYKVQLYSTVATGHLEQARIKIVTQ